MGLHFFKVWLLSSKWRAVKSRDAGIESVNERPLFVVCPKILRSQKQLCTTDLCKTGFIFTTYIMVCDFLDTKKLSTILSAVNSKKYLNYHTPLFIYRHQSFFSVELNQKKNILMSFIY
jgi:hypothetical protein